MNLLLLQKNILVQSTQRGFTLVETLVAISVLLLSITAPLSFAAQGIQNTYYARDQVVAYYFAVEGIELLRRQRDANALAKISWTSGIPGACSNVSGCGVDAQNPTTFVDCGSSPYSACGINFDSAGLSSPASNRGIYVLRGNGGVATTFVRRLQVNQVVANQESDLIAIVSWQTGSVSKTITVRGKMFNQYDNL